MELNGKIKNKTALKGALGVNSGGGSGGAVTSVNGQTGAVVLDASDVGLGNVNNTSDANKPISTATQTALNAKLDTNQGTAHAGKFLVVGSDGNITAVTMTAWSGGSY